MVDKFVRLSPFESITIKPDCSRPFSESNLFIPCMIEFGVCEMALLLVSLQWLSTGCLLYTSDAADEEDSVDLGGRRIIKKKKDSNTDKTRDEKYDDEVMNIDDMNVEIDKK
eukprot:TRINITY_DN7842_c0_g1_i6.p3 TRINITY_DN7842_c0_g1~~TRINITY_DN7842_c0_g1_i6.p3  ORF type:complete len:112 (-),score=20.49 TRINITY_DN7842_c0_g1_i6:3-338(-)